MREHLLNYLTLHMLTSRDGGAEARRSSNDDSARGSRSQDGARIDYEPIMILLVVAVGVVCAVLYRGGV
jgi:hypothetical protein